MLKIIFEKNVDIEKLKYRLRVKETGDIIRVMYRNHEKGTFLKELAYINSCNDEANILGVYGAIWTSKGLIYVAKMNDKGELELI